jgi:hypothetical protein
VQIEATVAVLVTSLGEPKSTEYLFGGGKTNKYESKHGSQDVERAIGWKKIRSLGSSRYGRKWSVDGLEEKDGLEK